MIAHFDESLPNIEIIPQDIGRVIVNIVNNAFYAVNERNVETLHATSHNDISETLHATHNDTSETLHATSLQQTYKPTVTLETRHALSLLEIRIKDNGTGMSTAIKEKIFQPFFTTKPTGQGTGLGLSLAYDIITKGHGGTLKVESIEGIGTAFIISLPI